MAIQDDFTIDYNDRKITYTTAFVDDRPPSIYTANELYSWLQDTFDEPNQMDDPIPMSAQTPTQYTLINKWYIDDESMKALYGGSIQTSGWTYAASEGITQLSYTVGSTDKPVAGDIGVTLTGGTSTATGILLAVDTVREVCWVRNDNGSQFQNNENVTGTGVDIQTETVAGFQTGETIWANLFSVGSLQLQTDIYIGQEDDYQGGRAYNSTNAYERRIEKIDEWWDSDVDFFTGSPNLLGGLNHFDVLVKTFEAGVAIDGGRLFVGARQFSTIYSHFELVASSAGNFVVPFSSTGADLNSADGCYNVGFDAGVGGKGQLDAGDIIENNTGETPDGRLRCVVTAVNGTTSGDFDYYLIGENEPLTTTNRTLRQFLDNEDMKVRGNAFDFLIDAAGTAVTNINGGLADPGAGTITVTFSSTQVDVDEVGGAEEYAATINCANNPLADVYKRMQFLTSRGNQNGTAADTQNTLLQTAVPATDEAGEFYRAIGDIIMDYDGGTGTQVSEGDYVVGGTSSATGVVISTTAGTTGVLVLHQVKGTFQDGEQVARPTEHGTNRVDVNGTPTSVVDNTGAPFGTFAGGRWFVAQGVVLTNVPGADANNWETVDLAGVRRAPPTQRTITFAGLTAGDRAFLAEVDTAGGIDITKNQNGVASGGGTAGDTTFELDTTVALDVPTAGWVRVVDVSDPELFESRFAVSSISGTTVTFESGAWSTGTATSLGSSTVLNDTGAFTNFGGTGEVRIGMMIRNTTDLSYARVVRKIDNNSIETTPLTSGTDDTWAASDGWEVNTVVEDHLLAAADTCYFPYVDDVATGTSIVVTVKFVHVTELVARARFSSPDIGGQRILPFQQTSVQLTDADLPVTAIRTDDIIAA